MECQICRIEVKNYRAISQHVKQHGIHSREYFTKYPRLTKRCRLCGIEKSRDEFYTDTYFNDQLSSLCKVCFRSKINERHNSIHWKKHKAEYDLIYTKNNADKILERRREYGKNNREKRKAYERARYNKNSEAIKKVVRKYLSTEKGRLTKLASVHRRLSKKNKINDTITREDILVIRQLFNYSCFKCNANKRIEVDHYKSLSDGNGLLNNGFNACILCRSCNAKKGNRPPEQFFTTDEIERYNKIKHQWEELHK